MGREPAAPGLANHDYTVLMLVPSPANCATPALVRLFFSRISRSLRRRLVASVLFMAEPPVYRKAIGEADDGNAYRQREHHNNG